MLNGLDAIRTDVRFGVRHSLRSRLRTVGLIGILGVGIAVDSAVFTTIRWFTTQPVAGLDNTGLVRIRGTEFFKEEGRLTNRPLSSPELKALVALSDVFHSVAFWSTGDAVVDYGGRSVGEHTAAATAVYVGPGYFQTLGASPTIGVPFMPIDYEPASQPIAILSHSAWKQEFGGAPGVLGTKIRVNNILVTIVGVAPPKFTGIARSSSQATVFLPFSVRHLVVKQSGNAFAAHPDSAVFGAVARLAAGVRLERASSIVQTVARQSASQSDRRVSADVVPLRANNAEPEMSSQVAYTSLLLASVALLLLLITCTNVSALRISAALERRREIGVRLALGATRGRIVRQLLTENVLLAFAGGMGGLLLVRAIAPVIEQRLPDIHLTPDWSTLAFTAAIALGAGLAFGLSPALHATRVGVGETMKESAQTIASARSTLQSSLIVAQIALTQPLLVGLGALLVLILQDPPSRSHSPLADRVIAMRVNVWTGAPSAAAVDARMNILKTRIIALPIVEAAVIWSVTYQSAGLRAVGANPADSGSQMQARRDPASPGHFGLLNVPILQGREFVDGDAKGNQAVAIVSSELARALWPGVVRPIGMRISETSRGAVRPVERLVVGVVDSKTLHAIDPNDEPRFFVPTDSGAGTLLVRTRVKGDIAIPFLRGIANADAKTPISSMATLANIAERERSESLRVANAAAAAGSLILLLSCVGLYGVVSAAVSRRVPEIGVRLALGARPHQVIALFANSGLRLSLLGVAIGLPLSLVALKLGSSMLGLRTAHVPTVGVAIPVVVGGVAFVASWLPARRAARVDPLLALRTE